MPAPLPLHRSDFHAPGVSRATRQDLGLIGSSIILAGVAFFAASESVAFATGTTVAISTAAAMYSRLAMERWRAAAQTLGCAVLLAVLGAPPRLIGLLLITGLAGAELVARYPQRSAILKVSASVAALAFASSVSRILAVMTLPTGAGVYEALAAAIGAFLGAPLMLMFAPLAERLFGHITRLTMSDWLSYEQPLLRRLAAEAPGTFQHSVNVGVLADAGASAIGADPLLARVGGLYHDVGKLQAPEYFIENQHGSNPHDSLDPAESARVIRAHVLDGVDLVDRHRMGARIADFVREHHGSGEMRLLKDKAASLGQASGDDTYQYPGPRPRSRETGLLMIADQLEATARSQVPVDEAACEQIVRATIGRIQQEGQLDDSGLTLGDLAAASLAFSRALQAMYHRRMSYPPSDTGVPRPRLVFPRRARRGIAS